MAHRCWAVDDIVRIIIAYLVSPWWISGRASAVALASCCKSLEEPALREVWRSLNSLEPLVKCFPPEVWEIRGKERNLFFKRAPFEAEWTRFQKRYASKVQYLRIMDYSLKRLPYSTLHLLQLYSSEGPLLPNLVSLNWRSDEKYLPLILPLISPSLTSVVIDVPRMASPMLPPVFKRLSTSSQIRKIKIKIPDHDSSMEEASSQLVMHCNHHLRKFQVDSPISASALRHVFQLPSLEEFRLVDSIQLPDPLPIRGFPSLRELDVECNGDLSWLKLLPAIESRVLTTISVNCPGLESEVERFMETFQLTMIGCGMHACLKDFTVLSPDDSKITPQIIARILSFNNLTSLTLSSDCSDVCSTSDLRDDDIDLLTKAMPFLRTLSIGSTICGIPSQITFKSLYTISRRCTRLKDLTLHFDPTLFVTNVGTNFNSWDVALGLSDLKTPSSDLCQVTTLFLGNLPFPSHHNASFILALGLVGVFPRLEGILFEEDSDDWGDVATLIAYCRRMGSFTFVKG